MSNNKSLLCGLVVGGMIGGIAALLTAPSSGKELRGQLNLNRLKIQETLNQLKPESIAFKNQVMITAKESSDVIKDISTDLKSTINQFQQDIEPDKKDLQKEIEEVEQKITHLEQTLQI